ncbi:MAG: DHH family phosphoesterase, partial [Bdellovibrionales bacterium]|nr:DHH family phosphoesterase [Bdellovibrionales bacterium]
MINYTTRLNSLNVSSLTKKIKDAKSIILTTHKQCDGDGLGAALGLYHGLKKIGKEVRVMMVDEVPTKYNFLDLDKYIETFNRPHKAIENTDLALIFDTNDRRIVEPLYSTLEEKCDDVLFVDHHPVLNDGPEPTAGSYIETKAASTGEISYFIIKDLGIRMDKAIARALYTSISFDTQLFRFVRGSGTSHLICAELLEYEKNPEEIHREIFSTYSIGKVMFLSKVLSDIEYFADGQVAVVHIEEQHLNKHEL